MKMMRSLVCWLGVFLIASALSVAQAASGLPSGWTDDFAAAKVRLFETDRFGPFLSLSDMAEVFSAAAGCDAFAVFCTYGKRVRKEDVAQKLRGFSDEPFEEEGEVRSVSAEVKGKSGDAESRR